MEDPYLRGLRVLLTRPADQAEETAAAVIQAGGVPCVHPCLELAPPPDPGPLDAALRDLAAYDIVALSSANAVRALRDRAQALGVDLGAGHALVAAVGKRTAEALRQLGVRVDLVAEEATAEGLAAALRRAGAAGRSVLIPRALEGREILADLLAQAGARVSAVAAYRMVAAPPARLAPAIATLRAGEIDVVPFGSPRTAAILLEALGPSASDVLAMTAVGAIGPTTAAPLRDAGVRVDVVARPSTFEVLLRELGMVARQRRENAQAGHKQG